MERIDDIPIIDLSSLASLKLNSRDYDDIEEISDLVDEIREACEKWGFFQVINHGVPLQKLEKLEQTAREFFALPMDEKMKVSRNEDNPMGYIDRELVKNERNWRQVFDFTSKEPTFALFSPDDSEPKRILNRWPESPSHLREIGQDYVSEVEELAYKLMRLIAVSLGLEPTRFDEFFKEQTSFVRINHYPPCPSPGDVTGFTQHKDAGALTILAQDDVGGLQVKTSEGDWISVKPNPGAFIINVGDIIQVWSNDRYQSVEHKVTVNSKRERMSIPYFLNPAHYVWVKPLEELVDEQNQAKYKEYNWGMFYASKRFSNIKKLNLDNIQVANFKI